MRTIRWIARQSAAVPTRRWKVGFSWGILLLGLHAPASSAPGIPPKLAPEQILARMEQRYEQQLRALESYQDRRRYSITHPLLGSGTYLLVEENYLAPEQKRFQVLERGGSSAVQGRVFSRLLQVEQETARESQRRQVDLCRRNYHFTFQEYDTAAGAYVFEVKPQSANPYLLRGKVWINAQDFAVQRIEGEPATRHSVLIRQTRFVHEFARFGDYWFPVRHRSETDLLLFGRAILEISYFDYQWKPQKEVHP